MPSYNRRGDLLASSPSSGEIVYWPQGFVGSPHEMVKIGPNLGPGAWLSDDEVIYQNNNATQSFLEIYDTRTERRHDAETTHKGATTLVADSHLWAAYLASGALTTRFSTDVVLTQTMPLSISAIDKSAVLRDWAGTSVWQASVETGAVMKILSAGSGRAACQDNGECFWQLEDLSVWWNGQQVMLPISASKLCDVVRIGGIPWLILQGQESYAYAIGLDDPSKGFKFGEVTAFQPSGWFNPADGQLRLASASTAGESWASVSETRVFPTERVPLGPPVPTAKPFQAWPMKAFVGAFFCYSEKYGPTPELFGNIQIIVDDETDQDAIYKTLAYVESKGIFPLIIGDTHPGHPPLKLTQWQASVSLGWFASGGDMDALKASVQRVQARNYGQGQGQFTLAYLDRGDRSWWGTSRPSWLTDDCLPTFQMYPRAGESLAAFEQRMVDMIEPVSHWGLSVACVPRFDCVPSEQVILASMPVYERLIRRYRPGGIYLFSDGRGSGMRQTPSLKQQGDLFWAAVPERPSRYDYFIPRGMTPTEVIKKKLAQDISLYFLTAAERTKIVIDLK
jgi:hypothetical protein